MDRVHHCGLIVFDLKGAETPDDEAIERFVQQLCKFAIRKAKAGDLSFPDTMCAAIEFAARLVASATTFVDPGDADETLVADMTNNFRNRVRGAMEARPPSDAADVAKPQ